MAQQLWHRHYDDNIQSYDKVPPNDAPDWSYVDQPDMIYDTEYTAEDDDDFNDDELDESNVVLASKEDLEDKSESFMQED